MGVKNFALIVLCVSPTVLLVHVRFREKLPFRYTLWYNCFSPLIHVSTAASRQGGNTVTNIAKIQEEILALSETDYLQLKQWFDELAWEKWDRQIEEDSNAGKLDFLIAEALEAKEKGTLKNLEDL